MLQYRWIEYVDNWINKNNTHVSKKKKMDF